MSILSNGHQWKLTEFVDNKKYSFDRDQILNSLTSKDIDDAFNSISKWEGYSPTPLVKLNKLINSNAALSPDKITKKFEIKINKIINKFVYFLSLSSNKIIPSNIGESLDI